MHNTIRFTVAVFLFSIFSCGENSEIFIPDESIGNINDLYQSITQKPESKNFNTQEDFIFTTSKGNKIFCPAYSLVTLDGDAILEEISIEVLDFTKPGEFILNGLNTMSANLPLALDKVLNINFIDNNKRILRLKDGAHISILLSSETNNVENSIFAWSGTSWKDMKQSEVPFLSYTYGNWTFELSGGTVFGKGYIIKSEKTGWIAFGVYAKDIQTVTTSCLNLPNGFNQMNTKAYLITQDGKYIMEFRSEGENTFCLENAVVPQSDSYNVVSLTSKSISNYAGSTTINMAETNISLNPTLKTKPEIVEILNKL